MDIIKVHTETFMCWFAIFCILYFLLVSFRGWEINLNAIKTLIKQQDKGCTERLYSSVSLNTPPGLAELDLILACVDTFIVVIFCFLLLFCFFLLVLLSGLTKPCAVAS